MSTKTQQELRDLLENRTYGDGGQIFDSPLYDRIDIANGLAKTTLFQNKVGSGTPPKALAATNFEGSGQMPSGHFRRVDAIKVFYTPAEVRTQAEYTELMTYLRDMTFEFKVSGLDETGIWKGLDLFNLSFPLVLDTGATNVVQLESQSVAMGYKPLKLPIYIDQLATFGVNVLLDTPVATTNLDGDILDFQFEGVLLRQGA